MKRTTIREILDNYARQQRIRSRIAQTYYRKLVKASLLISIVPIMVICILVVYARLSFFEGLSGIICVFFGSTFFAKPYLDDLSSLTHYVKQLSLDKKADAPPLGFLSNVDELSKAVKNLHTSWGKRKLDLEVAVAESTILFDTIPDILIMADDDLKIIRANHAALTSFGNHLPGKKLKSIISDPMVFETIEKVKATNEGQNLEATVKTHNLTHDYLVMIERFPVKSITGISFVMILHDVTEARRRKQMIKDFVANASHEIRTPLTSVVGFIENLRSMDEDDADTIATRKKFLDIMADQTERMSSLINDLLSLSKVEMNENTIPTEKVNIVDILQSVVRRLQFLASQKNMKIILKIAKKLPDVTGDENELTQVFTNLVSNAIKYGYENTVIDVIADETEHFDKKGFLPQGCQNILAISVTDKGEGISEENIPRITERFYRVDKTRSRKIGGTGLGLAITKHIINRHRGDMIIESKVGEGSKFTVRLPIT